MSRLHISLLSPLARPLSIIVLLYHKILRVHRNKKHDMHGGFCGHSFLLSNPEAGTEGSGEEEEMK